MLAALHDAPSADTSACCAGACCAGAPEPGLLRRLQCHDDDAWRAVVQEHGARLRRLGRGCRLGAHEVEDALQATWLALLVHADQVRDPACLGAWLSSSMRHECLRLMRTGGRRRECLVEDWTPYEGGATSEGEDTTDEREHMAAAVWTLVGRLPARQRALIEALYQPEPPSYADVSARMAMPVGAIGPTRQRALRHLRLLLDTPVPA